MEANEFPEKIYIQKKNSYNNIIEYDSEWTSIPLINEHNIEYIQIDAFIEKAKRWLEKNAGNYVYGFLYAENYEDDICGMNDDFIDDFVNYMKKEYL